MLLAFVVCVPILMYGNRVEMTYRHTEDVLVGHPHSTPTLTLPKGGNEDSL